MGTAKENGSKWPSASLFEVLMSSLAPVSDPARLCVSEAGEDDERRERRKHLSGSVNLKNGCNHGTFPGSFNGK